MHSDMYSSDMGLSAAGNVRQTDSSKWHHMHVEEISGVIAQGAAAGLYQQTSRAIIPLLPHDLLSFPTS